MQQGRGKCGGVRKRWCRLQRRQLVGGAGMATLGGAPQTIRGSHRCCAGSSGKGVSRLLAGLASAGGKPRCHLCHFLQHRTPWHLQARWLELHGWVGFQVRQPGKWRQQGKEDICRVACVMLLVIG